MKRIQILLTAALMMGFATFTFASTPKGSLNTSNKDAGNLKPSEAAIGSELYWYDVVYDAAHTNGYVPSGSTPIQAERSELEPECPDGTTKLCKVGYESQQTLPISNFGTAEDNITKGDE